MYGAVTAGQHTNLSGAELVVSFARQETIAAIMLSVQIINTMYLASLALPGREYVGRFPVDLWTS